MLQYRSKDFDHVTLAAADVESLLADNLGF